jgi:hypothetical protein
MLIQNSEEDGTNDLIPHAALCEPMEFLDKMDIVNGVQTGFKFPAGNGYRLRFNMQMWNNSTVWGFKKAISMQMGWKSNTKGEWEACPAPHPGKIRIARYQTMSAVKDDVHGDTLA